LYFLRLNKWISMGMDRDNPANRNKGYIKLTGQI